MEEEEKRKKVAALSELTQQKREVLGTLTPREEKVLRMRFGIGERSNHALEEVDVEFDVTRERVRSIDVNALRALVGEEASKRRDIVGSCGHEPAPTSRMSGERPVE